MDFMEVVRYVFREIGFKLNFVINLLVENFKFFKVKKYLKENYFKFCVLVVDVVIVKDVYDNLEEWKLEYEDFLIIVVYEVGKFDFFIFK